MQWKNSEDIGKLNHRQPRNAVNEKNTKNFCKCVKFLHGTMLDPLLALSTTYGTVFKIRICNLIGCQETLFLIISNQKHLISWNRNAIFDSLVHIFNLILREYWHFSGASRTYTRSTPVHKERNKSECRNYSPISIIPWYLMKYIKKNSSANEFIRILIIINSMWTAILSPRSFNWNGTSVQHQPCIRIHKFIVLSLLHG